MTDIPQLGPEVFVDDTYDITKQPKPSVSPFLSPFEGGDSRDSREAFITSGWDVGRTRRGTETSISGLPTSPTSPGLSPKQSAHKASNSSFSLEAEDARNGGGSAGSSRRGSAAENVLEVLDNSAWGESIRRSFTMRRPDGAGGRYP
jgi:hypothetical protein